MGESFELKETLQMLLKCNDMSGDFNNGEYMQFTGLLDKGGREIYERDIVRWVELESDAQVDEEMKGKYGEVVWVGSRAEFGADFRCGVGYFTLEYALTRWEVIGNIYENPDLLGKGE